MIFHVTLYLLAKFHSLITLPSRDIGNICITIVCQPRRDVLKFQINLSYQAFLLHDEKVKTKT